MIWFLVYFIAGLIVFSMLLRRKGKTWRDLMDHPEMVRLVTQEEMDSGEPCGWAVPIAMVLVLLVWPVIFLPRAWFDRWLD